MLDYDNLSRILHSAKSVPDASRCHGFLCGKTCAGSASDQEPWRDLMDAAIVDDLEAEACYEQIRTPAADIQAQFNSAEPEFYH